MIRSGALSLTGLIKTLLKPLSIMTFKESLQTPKKGWKHASDEQLLGPVAQIVARTHAISAKQLFNWAQKYDLHYDQLRKLDDIEHNAQLLGDVLNDQFKHTQSIVN